MAEKLTHVDQTGKVRMVDIGNKTPVLRRAVAQGSIILNQQARTLIAEAMI